MTALQLEWNSLQSEGVDDHSEMFAQLLTESCTLIFLSLRANGITSRGAVALAKALRNNKTLEALNLFQNDIDDSGARAFAHALPLNATLKTLSLANNKISGCGYVFIISNVTIVTDMYTSQGEDSGGWADEIRCPTGAPSGT